MWSVFFVFLSYLDRNFVKSEFLRNSFLDAEKEGKEMFLMLNSTFCAKMSVMGENYLYQVSDGIEEVRSVHDPAGKLVDCSMTVNQMQVKSFMHVCRLGLRDQTTKPEDLELSFANMAEAKSNCLALHRRSNRARVTERIGAPTAQNPKDEKESSVPENDKVLRRSKRGFTYPGTLWCGAGNMADHYDHLGEFAQTDSCCRIHDHCPYVIHAFSSKYGYTNFKWHPLCHCDCDNALKDCLRKVNDTASRVVGQAFFNVIEAPCFEFAYEEQCVERHWYGVCKKYDKQPVAVARESVPYDIGGIDVIDVLTLAPPEQKESKKAGKEQDTPEGTTQSSVPGSQTAGLEEPSLRNVMTAAEDFIKVLATVSTSQSSSTDTTKGDAQTSDKKKRKNGGKKRKNTKRRRKGKGRKRKQNVDFVSKAEEGATVTPPSIKAEEIIDKSNFVNEPGKIDKLNRDINNFIDGAFDLGGKEELSNDVMRDEPMIDNKTHHVPVTPPTVVKKERTMLEQTMLETQGPTDRTETTALASTTASSPTSTPHKTKRLRSRKGEGRKRQSNIAPTPPTKGASSHDAIKEELLISIADISGNLTIPTTTTEKLPQQRFESPSERGPVTTTASSPIVTALKSKRHRSKAREETIKRRKSVSTPMALVSLQNSAVGELQVITSSGAPTIPATITSVNTAEQLVSHRPHTYSETAPVTWPTTAVTSTLGAPKTNRHRSKERVGRKRRRKIIPSENASLQTPAEDGLQMLTTDNTGAMTIPTTTTTVITTGQLGPHRAESQSERGHLTATARTSIVTAERIKSKEREGRKKQGKILPRVFNDGVSIHNNDETELGTMTSTRLRSSAVSSKVDEIGELQPQSAENCTEQALFTVQTSTPPMTPIKLTVQKPKERLGKKKRRKISPSSSPQ